MISSEHIAVVVVTYNRLALLERCVAALRRQTLQPETVLVVDNASTDGTGPHIGQPATPQSAEVRYVRLPENIGGAGGFREGLRVALASEAEWIWMMDDDAEPHADALEELAKVASNADHVYGSLAICGELTSWTVTLAENPTRRITRVAGVPPSADVESLPFLGFLIHRDLVGRIGLPDAGFFIAADDIEYCIRAKRAGARLVIASRSRIEHPRTPVRDVRLFGHEIPYLSLPPWKRYYDTRNRLLVARRYYGIRLLTEALPGSFVRLFTALRHEPCKLSQLWAFLAGLTDGLLGLKGRRHARWRISQ